MNGCMLAWRPLLIASRPTANIVRQRLDFAVTGFLFEILWLTPQCALMVPTEAFPNTTHGADQPLPQVWQALIHDLYFEPI